MIQKPKRTNWTEDEIVQHLSNPKVLERAILAMYRLQTPEERALEETRDHNGIGWNASDAKFLSSLAQQIASQYGRKEGEKLSIRQRMSAFNRMRRYRKQLTRIANGEL